MEYKCKKTENCFENSETYEYRLPVTGETFIAFLPEGASLRKNERLRRPVFIADHGGINIKGMLAADRIRVSFPAEDCERRKSEFEDWIGGLNV